MLNSCFIPTPVYVSSFFLMCVHYKRRWINSLEKRKKNRIHIIIRFRISKSFLWRKNAILLQCAFCCCCCCSLAQRILFSMMKKLAEKNWNSFFRTLLAGLFFALFCLPKPCINNILRIIFFCCVEVDVFHIILIRYRLTWWKHFCTA